MKLKNTISPTLNIIIHSFMRTLEIKGITLNVYAIIYSFTVGDVGVY